MYLNSVQQMVSGELAGECLQRGFERHGLPPQRTPLDTVYPLREHLNSVQRMVSGGYCEGLFPDTVCWTRLRNTWWHLCRTKLPRKKNELQTKSETKSSKNALKCPRAVLSAVQLLEHFSPAVLHSFATAISNAVSFSSQRILEACAFSLCDTLRHFVTLERLDNTLGQFGTLLGFCSERHKLVVNSS